MNNLFYIIVFDGCSERKTYNIYIDTLLINAVLSSKEKLKIKEVI